MTTQTLCDWCGGVKGKEEWGTVQMFRKASYACLKDLCPECYMKLWDHITKTGKEVLIGGPGNLTIIGVTDYETSR